MSGTSSEPPRKKMKLNEDEEDYVPSDPEEEVSDYEASDDQDELDDLPSTTNNSNSKTNDVEEEKDPENDEDEEDNDDDDDDDMNSDNEDNDENKPKLSAEDKERVRSMFRSIDSMKATQLKTFLRNLKSLRSIDGESVFEDVALGGKKEELQKRVKNNILMIYLGQIVAPNKNKWSWIHNKVYKDTIDFEGWKVQIKQFINLILAQSSKKSRGKKSNCIMSASLISRLNACSKEQIIASLELLLDQEEDGAGLANALEELLPKPNLESVFKRHNVLINAISKAQPWTRYGSSSDDYCFKRCRSSINSAKKAIIADGKKVMDTKEWDTALEYLIVCSKNIENFPVWDNSSNNGAVRDLKKKFKIWHGKVVKGLARNVNEIQKKRLKQLETFFKEK